MEIAPARKGRVGALGDRLRALGFSQVAVESAEGDPAALDDPLPCMLYAVRAPR